MRSVVVTSTARNDGGSGFESGVIRKELGIQSHQGLIDRRPALKALGIEYQDAGSLSVYYDATDR